MSGMSFLCGLRAPVESFPMYVAFPRSEYYARYDSPYAYGGFSLSQYSSACLTQGSIRSVRFQHSPVSRFPLLCLTSCIPCFHLSPRQEPMGPPKFFDVSLPTCHGLMTPADLHILAKADDLVLPSVNVKTLGIRSKLISKLYQHFRVRVTPTAYRILCLRFTCLVRQHSVDSATGARLDTGGWLTLTRRGLSPRKIRQAYLDAVTNQLKQIHVFLTQNGFVAILKQMSVPPVPAIIQNRIAGQQTSHDGSQGSFACSQQNMDMIGNECPSKARSFGLAYDITQTFNKIIPVLSI